jgi:Peptidase family M23
MKIKSNHHLGYLRQLCFAVALCSLVLTQALLSAHAAAALRFAPTGGTITSEFGWRTDPFNQSKRFHAGLDIAAPTGTPVFAPEKATVFYSGNYKGYGNLVVLRHTRQGIYTLYGHNSKILVQQGQTVVAGQPIALVGSTGRSTGAHLHFEVHYNKQYMNPVDYLLFLQQELVASGQLAPANDNELFASVPIPMPPAMGGPVGDSPLQQAINQHEEGSFFDSSIPKKPIRWMPAFASTTNLGSENNSSAPTPSD